MEHTAAGPGSRHTPQSPATTGARQARRTRPGAGIGFRLLAVSSVVVLAGCSLLFVDGPPPAHASMQMFSCDHSRAWPMVDAGIAALSVVGMLTAETTVDTTRYIFGSYNTETTFASEQIAAGAVGLAVYGTSAFIGFRRVQRCRRAYAELRERLNNQSVALPALPHPGTLAPSPPRRGP